MKDKLDKIARDPPSAKKILTSPSPRKKFQTLNDSHYLREINTQRYKMQ